MLKENELIEVKEIRERFIGRIEALDKVKELITLPNTDIATTEQVARYYDVGVDTINSLVFDNRKELESAGLTVIKKQDIERDVLKEHNVKYNKFQGYIEFKDDTGENVRISNRGAKVFSRRAILCVGMLLRDSEIAKEIRTYLLNVEENAGEEVKQIEINRIEKEDTLLLDVLHSEDNVDMVVKLREYKVFKDSQIKKLETEKDVLVDGILRWDRRSAINHMLRKIASHKFWDHGKYSWAMAYNKLREEMLYRHNINIKRRITESVDNKATMFDVLNSEELTLVVKTCYALCENWDIDVSDILTEPEVLEV